MFPFIQGFTNPVAGACKAGVAASNNPQDGYNAAGMEGGTIETGLYEAKDVDGNNVKFKFRITAAAAGDQRPLFQVTELRYQD